MPSERLGQRGNLKSGIFRIGHATPVHYNGQLIFLSSSSGEYRDCAENS